MHIVQAANDLQPSGHVCQDAALIAAKQAVRLGINNVQGFLETKVLDLQVVHVVLLEGNRGVEMRHRHREKEMDVRVCIENGSLDTIATYAKAKKKKMKLHFFLSDSGKRPLMYTTANPSSTS